MFVFPIPGLPVKSFKIIICQIISRIGNNFPTHILVIMKSNNCCLMIVILFLRWNRKKTLDQNIDERKFLISEKGRDENALIY